jgi:predicted transcriptional regulator
MHPIERAPRSGPPLAFNGYFALKAVLHGTQLSLLVLLHVVMPSSVREEQSQNCY